MMARRWILGAALAGLLVVGACGDDDDGSGGAATTGTGGSGAAGAGGAGAAGGGGSGTAGGGGSTDCAALDRAACESAPACLWVTAECHGEVFAEGCFDVDLHPSPTPCADEPCPNYDTEPACAEQEACRWWPLDCPGHTITDQCLNIAYGDPDAICT